MSSFDGQPVRDAIPTAEGMFRLLCEMSTQLDRLPNRRLFLQSLVSCGQGVGITGAVVFQIQGSVLAVQESDGFMPGEVAPFRSMPISAALPATDAARSGLPVLIGSRQQLGHHYPTLVPPTELGDSALASVPIERNGTLYGVLGLRFGCPVDFDPAFRAGLSAIAGLCACVPATGPQQLLQSEIVAEEECSGSDFAEMHRRMRELEKQVTDLRSLMAFVSRTMAQQLEG
jgi:hypothetical protein